jgi:hypothetical protein
MNTPFISRNAAEAWLTANRTPAPAKLQAFLDNDPRLLPCMPKPGMGAGALRFGLFVFGTAAFTLLGWAINALL